MRDREMRVFINLSDKSEAVISVQDNLGKDCYIPTPIELIMYESQEFNHDTNLFFKTG